MVYNNVEGSNLGMVLMEMLRKIPSVFISNAMGKSLKRILQLFFNNTMANRPSPEADQLSDFSSWGVTTDGQLKPDVTAPGGNIFFFE